jgi:hypothetical protein
MPARPNLPGAASRREVLLLCSRRCFGRLKPSRDSSQYGGHSRED